MDGGGQLFGDDELAPAPEKLCVDALAVWNGIAPDAGWPAARFLTASRRAALRRAIKDYGGLAGWKTHLTAASKNDFLTGKTDRDPKHRNWRPDIDWFLKPANVLKVLEGKWPANTGEVTPAAPRPGVNWRARLDRYKPKGWWHVDTEGPRPEDPGPHKAPAELIEAWRKRHRIAECQAPPAETREQRMAASIVSYRRHGRWGDANRLEEELARIEGRAPVLVPAPDAVARPRYEEAPPIDDDDYAAIPEGDDFGGE